MSKIMVSILFNLFSSNWMITKNVLRSKQCQHVVDNVRLNSKNRCPRCHSLAKNICPGKDPKVYNTVKTLQTD